MPKASASFKKSKAELLGQQADNAAMSFGLPCLTRFRERGCFGLWAKACLGILLGVALHSAEPPQRFKGRLPFKVFGPDQGLKSGSPTDIAFDSRGFLWLGTENGLFRYAGGTFRKEPLANASDTWVKDLFPSRQGGLWLSTQRNMYHYRDGKFTPINVFKKGPGNPNLSLDAEGNLWAYQGQKIWKEEASTFKPVFTLTSPMLDRVRPQTAQVGPKSGLFRVVAEQKIWVLRHNRLEILETGVRDIPLGLREDGTGCLWIATDTGLYRMRPGESKAHTMSHLLPGPFFRDGFIQLDPAGRLWIPTHQGFLIVKGDEHEVMGPEHGLPMTWVRQALHDAEGNLWVIGSKLARLQGQGRVRNHGISDGLPVEIAWTFYQDRQKRLWAGTHQGVCHLGPSGWELLPGTENSSCHSLAEDHEGNLWIGASSSPLRVLRKGQTRAQNINLQPKSRDPELSESLKLLPHIPCMASIDEDLWIFLHGVGLFRMDPKSGILVEKIDPCGLDSAGIYFNTLRRDAKNRIWMSSNNGLFCRLQNGQWLRMKEGLKQTQLHGLELCPNPDEVWVHYDSANGLSRIRLEQGQFHIVEALNESHGLISNLVLGTSYGPNGELWISTDQGVDCFQKGRFTHYGLGRGILSEDTCEYALFTALEGDIWVGTSQGISCIAASTLPTDKPPVCHLTALLQKGKPLPIPFPVNPRIKAKDATLEFRFESPTYRDESRLRFQVRMIGLEPEWRDVEEHTSRYTSLKGGNYSFEVRAGILGEDWGPITRYEFSVLSPWWQRWWAYVLYVCAISGATWYFVKWRLRRVLKDKARSEALLIQKTQDLQIASHRLTEANKALETMSLVDPLTGLYNRRYLPSVISMEALRAVQIYREVKAVTPLPNQDLVIFVINLDKLSSINEQFGHGAGDAVLKRSAQILKNIGRETDWVIRMSGDSFVMLARSSSRKDAPTIAERIRSAMDNQKMPYEKTDIHWTCSIGFAPLPFQPNDLEWMGWEKVLELTDACLCMAKDAGRNTWLGIQAKPELTAKTHGPQLPWEMQKLIEEGVLELYSNSARPFPEKRKRL